MGMLIAANVGVGIRGKEGLQAVRAADFSITEFKSVKHDSVGHFSGRVVACVYCVPLELKA